MTYPSPDLEGKKALRFTRPRLKSKVPKPRQYQKVLRVSPGELAAIVVHCDETESEYGVGSGGLHVHPSRFRRSELKNIGIPVYEVHLFFTIKKTHLLRQPFCNSSSASSTDET